MANGVEQVSVAQIGIHLSILCAALSAVAPDVTAMLLTLDLAYISGTATSHAIGFPLASFIIIIIIIIC